MATPLHVHVCPQCGAEAHHVHRHLGDRLIACVTNVRRYRCMNPICEWEGIISTPPPGRAVGEGSAPWGSRLLWMLMGAGLAAVALFGQEACRGQAVAARTVEAGTLVGPALSVIPGVSYDGEALPPQDSAVVRNETPLTLRRGCAWGVPGRSPYRGTVEQALTAARVPDDVVRSIAEKVARGDSSGQLEITREAIRTVDGTREFDTTITAMGFGTTLCFGTRVNFKAGHQEPATLYDARSDAGVRYAVMVPAVCGNVSVLAEHDEAPPPPAVHRWDLGCMRRLVLDPFTRGGR